MNMPFKFHYIPIVSFIILLGSCSQGTIQDIDTTNSIKSKFEKTNIVGLCDNVIKEFKLDGHGHGVVYVSNIKAYLDIDSLFVIMNYLKTFEISDSNQYHTFTKNCEYLRWTIWKSKLKEETMMSRIYFETMFKHNDTSSYPIQIIEYEIHRIHKPKHILFRVSHNGTIENLIIDGTQYSPLYESELIGARETITKFDSLKHACHIYH